MDSGSFSELGDFSNLNSLFVGGSSNEFLNQHKGAIILGLIVFFVVLIFILLFTYLVYLNIGAKNPETAAPFVAEVSNNRPGNMSAFRLQRGFLPEYSMSITDDPRETMKDPLDFPGMVGADPYNLDNYTSQCLGFTGGKPVVPPKPVVYPLMTESPNLFISSPRDFNSVYNTR